MLEPKPSYLSYFKNKAFVWSVVLSLVMLVMSLLINFYAGTYATEKASNSVTDIILSNVRVFNLDEVFVYGTFFFWIFFMFICFRHPYKIPFSLKAISLFTVIRSIFISLTHIGPFPGQVVLDSGHLSAIISKFSFGADLFFSGHTGLPFLLALIFWETKILRIIFILSSISFAVVVLLAHLHYSIDVLSAFFITYTIFHLSEIFFKKDRALFFNGIR